MRSDNNLLQQLEILRLADVNFNRQIPGLIDGDVQPTRPVRRHPDLPNSKVVSGQTFYVAGDHIMYTHLT